MNHYYTMIPVYVIGSSGDALVITSQTAIIAVVFFILGFISGYLTALRFDLDGKGRFYLAILIMLVWALSVIAGILVDGYTTSVFVHAIMGSVVGYLFGIENPLKNK